MELILIRGLPGSGKTTLAKKLATVYTQDEEFVDCEHVEADQYFEGPEGYQFDPSLLPQAHGACQEAADNYLAAGKSVVVSNTFTQFWEMKPYYDIAAKYGINIRVIVTKGNFDNVHDIPPEVIERMRARWQS